MSDAGISHIGVILDGNRRFAKRLMLQPWKGHEWGAKKVREFLDWCREAGIKTVTLYTFSVQNFNRPKPEFDFLMELFEKEFTARETWEDIEKNKIKVNVIGRKALFPENLQKIFADIEERTKNNNQFTINFAIGYGGQEEITDAVVKITKDAVKGLIDPDAITEETVRHSLYTNGQPYPELIIRTGGERRLSNFLTWQSAYSELIFLDKFWPDLTKEDFFVALEEYKKRERRFGR